MPDDTRPVVHGLMARTGQDMPRGPAAQTGKFGRMFDLPALEPPDDALLALGMAMFERDQDAEGDNQAVPAGFTYLGQFVDHDITFDPTSLQETVIDPLALHNFRTPALDLDSLYGAGPGVQPYLYRRAPEDPDLFEIGVTAPGKVQGDPAMRDKPPFRNDLPRASSGLAIIGDPRNDENLIVAQLHLAMMKLHNEVVAQIKAGTIQREAPVSRSVFDEARDLVIRHYQWIVLHDFLGRILDAEQLQLVLERDSTIFDDVLDPFMPVEFSMAAYRLGHSMVRDVYAYNRVFSQAPLFLIFLFSGRSGVRGSSMPEDDPVPIPSYWIIDWRRFFDLDGAVPPNPSRKLNPFLAQQLSNIPNVGNPSSSDPAEASSALAVRNLFRGRRAGLPSGQSVAGFYGLAPLTADQIATGTDGAVAQEHDLHVETPLWYYILKEAEIQGAGERLGQVGSRIVAEVFVGLLKKDASSYLNRTPAWTPTLPSSAPGDFTMADLIRLVGDINPIAESADEISSRTLADLRADNPNIDQQLSEWRTLRRQRGEDHNDFRAFRRHLLAIGAPDPGEQEFVGFRD